MKKSNVIICVGMSCLALSIIGQTAFSWPWQICSTLAGVFLLSLAANAHFSKRKKEKEELDRQQRLKSLGH